VLALTSQKLAAAGFRHAFFTRQGGVSVGPYESLNFSYTVGDEPQRVDENFRRAEAWLSLAPGRLVYLSQVHGSTVVELEASAERQSVKVLEGDALVSSCSELGLGVRSADCIPVLLGDPETGAAAAVHAGWRGLVKGAIREAVCGLAVPAERLIVAIGPHIGPLAFEVSDDVAASLDTCSTASPVLRRPGSKPHVDLARIAVAQLVSSGVPMDQIEHVEGCTATDPTRFFSFRRDGQHSGRHLSAIVPRLTDTRP
jgi:YfiH family protein